MLFGYPQYSLDPRTRRSYVTTNDDELNKDIEDDLKSKGYKIMDDNGTGDAAPLSGINPLGTAIQKGRANSRNIDCGLDCGSFLTDPSCYIGKLLRSCGGSTGFCDAFGSGEMCTGYAKYIIIGGGIILAVVLLKQFKVF